MWRLTLADATDFAKLVPGFDFLQGLMKNAGNSLPAMGQWIAPTLNPEELEKRIGELRTVQFWLEQNARMLGATIQALQVQRMTLSTLKTMNLPLAELRESMTLAVPSPKTAAAPASAKSKTQSEQAAPAVVDPLQWWGALTQQFSELAAQAMKESTADTAKAMAGAVVKSGIDAAGQTLKKVVSAPARAAATAVRAGRSAASRPRAPTGKR
jgi:hypothetical protein